MDTVILEKNGLRKEVKVGFSWTMFFFGPLVPLFRGDLKWAIILFIAPILVIIMCFTYNKTYIKGLIEDGWQPLTEDHRNLLISKDIIS